MKRKIFFLCLLMPAALITSAQQSAVFIKSGVAINGYDPVAYFKEGKPVKGNEKLRFKWNDANWIFTSQQNLDSFSANPSRFAPQYGGYCAYGLSEGHKAPTSPDAWTIVDGKLYLNYNIEVKRSWTREKDKRIKEADKNWLLIKDKE